MTDSEIIKQKYGRPTEYTLAVVDIAYDYIETYNTKYGNQIPSVEGLAKAINRARSTIYKWVSEDDKVFSDILEQLMSAQKQALIDNGLSNTFNSTITKLILTKHGLSDKVETEHSGTMHINRIERVIVDPDSAN